MKQPSTFKETNKVKILGDYDVIVVGGGIAGVSAALSAKRNGCSTLIIEKSTMLGGLATLGLIAIYLPLCDGKGRQVIGGIAEELLALSIKYGYNNLPQAWQDKVNTDKTNARYRTVFSPPEFVITLDEIMEQEDIDILFDTVFSMPVMNDNTCTGVILENKTGRVGYKCKMLVDTTGDADVFARANATCVESDNWLSLWAYGTDLESMKTAVETNNIMAGIKLRRWGGDAKGKKHPELAAKYFGTDAQQVTEFILEGRKLIRDELKINKDKTISSLTTLPGMAQFRTTRRIEGCYELTESDMFKHFEDSIGCTGDWRKAGPIYEIPYRTLINARITNIITAGRSIAAKGDTWEVTRVIPAASLTGQGAGTAAALAIKQGCSLQKVSVERLQENLAKNGVLIHY